MQSVIRRAEPYDYEGLHSILSGPGAIGGTLQLPLPSKERWRRRLAEPPEGLFSLVAVAGSEVVGSLEANENRRTRHVGHLARAVRDDWQSRGVGTRLMEAALDLADNWLNLTRLKPHVFADNVAAIAFYREFGFEVEGTHRRFAFRDGEHVDAHSMARLRD